MIIEIQFLCYKTPPLWSFNSYQFYFEFGDVFEFKSDSTGLNCIKGTVSLNIGFFVRIYKIKIYTSPVCLTGYVRENRSLVNASKYIFTAPMKIGCSWRPLVYCSYKRVSESYRYIHYPVSRSHLKLYEGICEKLSTPAALKNNLIWVLAKTHFWLHWAAF